MRWLLAIIVVSVSVVFGGYTAEAGGKYYKGNYYGHGGHHHGYNKHYYNHGYYDDIGDDILLGAAIVGGAILLGEFLSQPQHPPAAYYAPPPQPMCTRKRVYRYLPDGRIQWGVRTTCY